MRLVIYIAKAEYEKVWKRRKDGVWQRYRHRSGRDQEPRLGADDLPADITVPDDRLLRGASPQEVVGAVTKWLRDAYPPPRAVRPAVVAESRAQVGRALEHLGLPPNFTDIPRAVSRNGAMVFFPPVAAELRGAVAERAAAARTVAHEYFHASRVSPARYTPFFLEEGMADIFADVATRHMLGGADLRDHGRYKPLSEAAARLLLYLGGDEHAATEWLLKTRRVPRLTEFIEVELSERGVSHADIDAVLYYTDPERWSERIGRIVRR